ncbi:MAG TPA: type II toxin-antitoxin system death-on-curing family toxin [Cyclobacteriaceae bacterium]|mgnify:CR=1 FL=1|nr:type II toxin-antitoxin system death-on-curing family toxin [Cyclobacteriaceae bacterium]
MISLTEAERIHEILIDSFGGASGIRDRGILESAIHRPYQTFDGQELYPNPIDKSAAIFESIISNHPFIDGNKRTAYVLMRLVLKDHNMDINVGQNEKFDFVMRAAKGELNFDEIRNWIRKSLK